ncbi:MAG TPA: hypothetical protein PK760_06615, partial [Flavobacteriales bacterium]|nr:hypothetical protein [Flavobacteriales bacterium]
WERRSSMQHALLRALLSLVGLSFRLAVAPLGIGMVLWMLAHRAGWKRALMVVGTLSVCIALVPWVHAHLPLEGWSVLNLFRHEHHSDDGVLTYRLPNVLYVLSVFVHPGFITIGAFVLPFFKRSDLQLARVQLAACVLLVYLLFIAGMPYQNDRVLLLALPFAAMILQPAFMRAYDFVAERRWKPQVVVVALALVQFVLFVRAAQPFAKQAEVERCVTQAAMALHPTHIYTHGLGGAFNTYAPDVHVTELWYGAVDRFESRALIVVQPSNLTTQWNGRQPQLNWIRAQAQGLVEEQSVGDDWIIARVR